MIVSVHFSVSGFYSSTHISVTAFILRKPFEAPITLHLSIFLASISHFIYKYSTSDTSWYWEFCCCCCCCWLFAYPLKRTHARSFSWQNPFFTCQPHAWCLSKHLNNIPSWGVYTIQYRWMSMFIHFCLSVLSLSLIFVFVLCLCPSISLSSAHLIRLFFSLSSIAWLQRISRYDIKVILLHTSSHTIDLMNATNGFALAGRGKGWMCVCAVLCCVVWMSVCLWDGSQD